MKFVFHFILTTEQKFVSNGKTRKSMSLMTGLAYKTKSLKLFKYCEDDRLWQHYIAICSV